MTRNMFKESQKWLAFQDRFEQELQAIGRLKAEAAKGIRFNRKVIKEGLPTGPSVEEMLNDIRRCGRGQPCPRHVPDTVVPSDILLQHCPGADFQGLEVDSLVDIDGVPDCSAAPPAQCVP